MTPRPLIACFTALTLASSLAATDNPNSNSLNAQAANAERKADKTNNGNNGNNGNSSDDDAEKSTESDSAASTGTESAADTTTSQDSEVQSAARPYNLDIAAPVQVAGSDAASADFQANVLPGMLELINQNLSESTSVGDASAIAIDPANLVLTEDATVRVYFLGEGAGYANTLGYSTTGGSPLSEDAQLIFPNVSSSGTDVRTSSEPLVAGDFVDLGTFTAGTALDFFLIANGANGGTDFFSTQQSLNADGIVHAITIAADGSAYLIIGFEDLMGGGDQDYNDAVFAVQIGKVNVANLAGLGAPEPSLAAGALLSCCALGFFRRRKHA
ncbi:DUF4114 domain-containing protein [Luteolibacter pohnpeiensis]|uniref:DUF4114 domain-containing protein n=1 Tax=Luteolibacter pohnpeiensis TaxID=454153 RepID=A0A934S950_9BACT|nr:DUF4114 domain-containing protein [Luteolibacter pohnpeiensis]MBK1881649.1 DUF4114 domain-containing protein [Luteolibacter pohnpeiensis]